MFQSFFQLRKFIYDEEDDEVISSHANEIQKLPSPRALDRSSSSQMSSSSSSARTAKEISKSPSPKSLEIISDTNR